MTPCSPEGVLRAWLDHELPPAQMEELDIHLRECRDCHGLCGRLEARATHVGALLEALDAVPLISPASPAAAHAIRPHASSRWVPVAVALAAGLALAFYLLPKRPAQRTAVSAAPATQVRAAQPPAPAAIPALKSALKSALSSALPSAAPRRPHRAITKPEEFIALDDEPFESGLIVRVDVPDTNVQADVVFSPDGRARAYRLIQTSSRIGNKERSNE
jgi:hypothetical protein